MKIVATIQAGDVVFTRTVNLLARVHGIGIPVTCELTIAGEGISDEREGGLMAALAAARSKGAESTFDVFVDDEPIATAVPLRAVGGRAGSRVLRGQLTRWSAEMLVPRWAAVRGFTPAELLASQDCVPTPEAADWLQDPLRGDRREVSVIQDGLSGRGFVERLLASLPSQLGLPCMAVSGSLGRDDDTAPYVQLARGEDYARIEPRPDGPAGADGASGPTVYRTLEALPGEDEVGSRFEGEQPSAVRVEVGAWTAAAWRSATGRPLPWAGDGEAWVHRVRDEVSGDGVGVRWRRSCHELPRSVAAPGPRGDVGLRAGSAWGRVETFDPQSPTVEVSLFGFDDDAARVLVHLSTPTSGAGENGGLHLVPEAGTTVLVCWSGRVDQPPVLLGNVRLQTVALLAPSLDLGREAHARLVELEVVAAGPVVNRASLDVRHERDVREQVDGKLTVVVHDVEGSASNADMRFDGDLVVETSGSLRQQCDGEWTAAVRGEVELVANGRARVGGDGSQLAFADGKVDVHA